MAAVCKNICINVFWIGKLLNLTKNPSAEDLLKKIVTKRVTYE